MVIFIAAYYRNINIKLTCDGNIVNSNDSFSLLSFFLIRRIYPGLLADKCDFKSADGLVDLVYESIAARSEDICLSGERAIPGDQ